MNQMQQLDEEALAQADRHCDLEGLPPPSQKARSLDAAIMDGRIQVNEAVSILLSHCQRGACEND